jgi:hypothetical protein
MVSKIVCVLEVENKNMKPRIGLRFTHDDKECVILQSGKNLPLIKQTGEEGEGPFFGVNYPNNEYVWYNYVDISKLLNQSKIQL